MYFRYKWKSAMLENILVFAQPIVKCRCTEFQIKFSSTFQDTSDGISCRHTYSRQNKTYVKCFQLNQNEQNIFNALPTLIKNVFYIFHNSDYAFLRSSQKVHIILNDVLQVTVLYNLLFGLDVYKHQFITKLLFTIFSNMLTV